MAAIGGIRRFSRNYICIRGNDLRHPVPIHALYTLRRVRHTPKLGT